MKTLDGYDLKDGDECFVVVQDPDGESRLSPKPRRAIYRSWPAKDMGWDFEIPRLKVNKTVEVVAVWKEYPRPKEALDEGTQRP